MRLRNWALWLATAIALVFDAGLIAAYWPYGFGADYDVFWHAVRASDAYAPSLAPFVYPPTTLLWLDPLRLVPFWWGYASLNLLSLVAYLLATRRLWGRQPAALALIAPAVVLGLIPGQLALLAASFLFAAFATQRGRGIWLALALTLKPQAIFMAPLFLLIQRDWRSLAGMGAVSAVVCMLTTLTHGVAIWPGWLAAVARFHGVLQHRDILRVALSPAELASAYGIPSAPVLAVGIFAAVAIALGSRRVDDRTRACMIGCASLLAAPYALRYDLVATAPLLAAFVLSDRSTTVSLISAVGYAGVGGPLSLVIAAFLGCFRRSGRREAVPEPRERRDHIHEAIDAKAP